MPELATFVAFLFLAALLVYVILQTPLVGDTASSSATMVDIREPGPTRPRHPAFRDRIAFPARLVYVERASEARAVVTGVVAVADGIVDSTGELVTMEVGRPEGWSAEVVIDTLKRWADGDARLAVTLYDNANGRRAWLSSGQAALDLPLKHVVGAQSLIR